MIFILGIVIGIFAFSHVLITDLSSVLQIKRDWKIAPFVELAVTDKSEPCAVGWEDVFTREWKGTVEGCFDYD